MCFLEVLEYYFTKMSEMCKTLAMLVVQLSEIGCFEWGLFGG